MSDPAPDRVLEQLEAKNVANILQKLQAGKVLSAAEQAAVQAYQEKQGAGANSNRRPTQYVPTARQMQFAQLVAGGMSQSAAYRKIYNPHAKPRRAAEQSCKMAALPHVVAEIARIRAKSERKALLSLNDRYEILAGIAQKPEAKDSDKVRAIDVYSRLAGDEAPQRHEIAGAGGAPLVPSAVTVAVRQMGARERLDAIKAARAARSAATAPA